MKTSFDRDNLLTEIRKKTVLWAANRLNQYIDEADNYLFNLESQSDNNEERTRLFETRSSTKRLKKALTEEFANHLETAFLAFDKQQATVPKHIEFDEDSEDNLTLIDNDELEQRLAVKTIIQKTSSRFGESIYILHQRLSALATNRKINEFNSPVSPPVFAHSMASALAHEEFDNRSVLLILKYFESTYMADLGKLYDQLNQLCIESGVLPNIRRTEQHHKPDSAQNEPWHQQTETSTAHQSELMANLQQLLSQQARPSPIGPVLQPDEILSALQQLQQLSQVSLHENNLTQESPAQVLSTLKQQVAEQTSNTDAVDCGTIEIVGLLFEQILDNDRLPDVIKTLLSYLHTPYLKVALLDQEFFNNPAHPARQLLNTLIAASERWAQPKSTRKGDLVHKIESIVNRIVDEFRQDLRFFTELVFELNQYLRQHARRVKAAEDRAKQAAEGEHKLQTIRLKIKAFINKKTIGCPLPSPVKSLLHEPWANYLSFVLLRYGSNSSEWTNAAQTVDNIVWYIRPHDNWSDKKRGSNLSETIENDLLAGFNTIGYDKSEGSKLIAALHKCNELATPPAPAKSAEPRVIPEAPIDEIVIKSDPLDDNEEIRKLLSEVDFGAWFLFKAHEKEPEPVKLAWYNSTTLRFMFVNRLGQQVATMMGRELAQELRSKQVVVLGKLEDKPFFESALEKLVEEAGRRNQHSN